VIHNAELLCGPLSRATRFLELQNRIHLSLVLHSLCLPTLSLKESIGLFAAKSLLARHWELVLKTMDGGNFQTCLVWSEAVPR